MAVTEGGFLISPRVRVLWGDINLSAYDGPSKGAPEVFQLEEEKGGAIVYNVKADLQAEGNGPTGEFNWDPSGPGYKAYEWFISQPKYLRTQITIEYFYPGGKKIVFFYRWAGQKIKYGNGMTVTVELQSELAGLINANQRSTAQAYDEKKGADVVSVYNRLTKQFGLSKYKNIIAYNKVAEKQSKGVKILNVYGTDQVFGAAVANMAKQAGHSVFANNIGSSGLIIYPPYSYKPEEDVLNGATDIGVGKSPDPRVRYGYLLGPSVINEIDREYVWQPPQKSKSNIPGTQSFASRPRDSQGRFTSASSQQENQRDGRTAAATTSAPLGVSGSRANPGIQNKDNPEGPDRQNALNEEKTAKLSFEAFLCPALVGIKPYDIVFVPSLKGDYIEDWIVQSVSYTQSNGNITVSVQATRIFGEGEAMSKKVSKTFLDFAKKEKLVGEGAQLDSWDLYAWSLR